MTENESFRPSRRVVTAGVAALAAGGLAVPLAGQAGAAARRVRRAAAQEAPPVVPALQEWAGGEGEFEVTSDTRVVTSGDRRLRRLARTLTGELEEVTGVRPRPPGTARGGQRATGEIRLTVDRSERHAPGGERYREEGSRITVTADAITVVAPTYAGAFHATRSLLQILVRSAATGARAVPSGTAVDWPDYARRGFMLDVGRRYFTPEFLRDYIRVMSWFKFNDFQIHLNDNEIKPPEGDWNKAQSAFRLRSEASAWAGLAARDGSYDRATWDSFEDLAEACAVRLTPEFDAPAHSRAFVKFRPDIGLDGGDHLDLGNPASTAFMKELFTHFTPWFRGPVVHYGADEYGGPVEQYRGYFNDIAAHIRSLGKEPAVWGSLSQIGGTAEGYDNNVRIHSWNNGWYGPQAIKKDGYEFVNMNDATLYIVPFADYYHGQGLDGRYLYEEWAPHVFPDGESVEPYDPALHGALFAVWNDLVHEEYTERDVHGLVNKTLGVLAQKMWNPRAEGPDYDAFQEGVTALGLGPGLELLGG